MQGPKLTNTPLGHHLVDGRVDLNVLAMVEQEADVEPFAQAGLPVECWRWCSVRLEYEPGDPSVGLEAGATLTILSVDERDTGASTVCDHGDLARKCPLCEAAAEIAELRVEVALKGDALFELGERLVDREREVGELRQVLSAVRFALESLPADALGEGRSIGATPDGEVSFVWSRRNNLIDTINRALAPGATTEAPAEPSTLASENAGLRAALRFAFEQVLAMNASHPYPCSLVDDIEDAMGRLQPLTSAAERVLVAVGAVVDAFERESSPEEHGALARKVTERYKSYLSFLNATEGPKETS